MPDAMQMADEALRLVGVDAQQADVLALQAIEAAAPSRDHRATSTAWRARGLAAREVEQLDHAESHLRHAVLAGRRAGKETLAEARMSLALVLLGRGDLTQARRLARLAVSALTGVAQARARVQLALIEQRSGALAEALDSYGLALAALRKHGDVLWEARLRNNRGILQAYSGRLSAAERDLTRAAELYAQEGQEVLAADVHWNLGFVAGLAGDPVRALQCFADAGERLAAAGVSRGSHFLDRCQVLLSVGLVDEARQSLVAGMGELVQRDLVSDLAEAQLLLSETLLAGGELGPAQESARDAVASFERQGRASLVLLATFALLRATASDGSADVWLTASATAESLRRAGWLVAATDVGLMAAQRAVAADRPVPAALVRVAETAARSGPAGQRMRAWHTVALARLSQGNAPGAAQALLAGLRVHEQHRTTLAATELQVHTAARAQSLAETGVRLALRSGDPARVLSWVERWRAGSLLVRPVRPPTDGVMAEGLAALRAVTAQLDEARAAGEESARLQREQRRLERLVADRSRMIRVELHQGRVATEQELLQRLGSRALVEYLEVDDVLMAVVVADGRSTLHTLPAPTADTEMAALRVGLARLARGGSMGMMAATEAAVAAGVQHLYDQLLAPLATRIEGRSLVVVPTGQMHAVPWGLLPLARDVPMSVAPSASVWLAAGERRRSRRGPAVVVAGPGLPGAEAEAAAIAGVYGPDALRFGAGTAMVKEVTAALSGSSYAHLACHGRFRSDNPQFSSLELTDGPLTVYDLEAVAAPPSVVVLSACDSGLSSIHPGDELMGLSAALLRAGTRTLVASVAPIPDELARVVMTGFHTAVLAGSSPAEALVQAREGLDDAGRLRAGALVCFGAG
ncbi:CHAT domain-containing protein [Acidothermaceae bacterium B102]|nr:CHAT domain-containing protein [Acidothermaceae bacterium B102]